MQQGTSLGIATNPIATSAMQQKNTKNQRARMRGGVLDEQIIRSGGNTPNFSSFAAAAGIFPKKIKKKKTHFFALSKKVQKFCEGSNVIVC